MTFKRAIAAATMVALAAGVAACGSNSTPQQNDQGLTVVKLRHSWIPDDIMLPVVVAKQQGYYKEVGIDLQDQVGDGSATAAKLVANGDVLIGTGEASTVLTSRANGLDLINIGTQFQRNSTVLVSMKSSNITKWSDLKGKRISISFTSSAYAALLATMKKEGLTPEDVKFVNLPPGSDLKALPSGQIDVACVFIDNIAPLDYKDDLNTLSFADAGITWPSTGYFVRADTVKNNKDLLTKWLGATLKGLQYTIDHPDQSAELMHKAYPDVDAAAVAAKWKLSAPYVTAPGSEQHGLGWQDGKAWATEQSDLRAADIVKKDVDVSQAFTNEIIDALPKAGQ